MAGIGTLGKLFFNFFLKALAGAGGAAGSIVSTTSLVSGLAGRVAIRQENNPGGIFVTARRIRRAPPAQNRPDGDSE
jgi:hypothetical protein